VKRGAQGLKIWKTLGLHARDQQGQLVAVNDKRLSPIWHTAGELNIPVLVHVADPLSYFQPVDRFNERYIELRQHPDWSFCSPAFPDFETILEQFADLVVQHPGTTFIGAHVGCYAEDLEWVGRLLDLATNYYVDISARLADLGRQPRQARQFLLKHQDRVLFGTDFYPQPDYYPIYYRFLETADEYFDYSPEGTSEPGSWKIYGLDLQDEVLAKIYRLNAQKVLAPN